MRKRGTRRSVSKLPVAGLHAKAVGTANHQGSSSSASTPTQADSDPIRSEEQAVTDVQHQPLGGVRDQQASSFNSTLTLVKDQPTAVITQLQPSSAFSSVAPIAVVTGNNLIPAGDGAAFLQLLRQPDTFLAAIDDTSSLEAICSKFKEVTTAGVIVVRDLLTSAVESVEGHHHPDQVEVLMKDDEALKRVWKVLGGKEQLGVNVSASALRLVKEGWQGWSVLKELRWIVNQIAEMGVEPQTNRVRKLAALIFSWSTEFLDMAKRKWVIEVGGRHMGLEVLAGIWGCGYQGVGVTGGRKRAEAAGITPQWITEYGSSAESTKEWFMENQWMEVFKVRFVDRVAKKKESQRRNYEKKKLAVEGDVVQKEGNGKRRSSLSSVDEANKATLEVGVKEQGGRVVEMVIDLTVSDEEGEGGGVDLAWVGGQKVEEEGADDGVDGQRRAAKVLLMMKKKWEEGDREWVGRYLNANIREKM
ncbi:hypothetical protein HDV05_005701 [Chytridiales sp. JEL 0842]|nr:hypothetical protein HDV05_005701 [Chytridiales sp. JEL 0842]